MTSVSRQHLADEHPGQQLDLGKLEHNQEATKILTKAGLSPADLRRADRNHDGVLSATEAFAVADALDHNGSVNSIVTRHDGALTPAGTAYLAMDSLLRRDALRPTGHVNPSTSIGRLGTGFRDYPVATMHVVNASPYQANGNSADAPPNAGRSGADLMVNGTFTYDAPYTSHGEQHRGYHTHPCGAIMRHGTLDTPGLEKAGGRGAVAVLADGRVAVVRQQGFGMAGITKATAGLGSPLTQFMGGGALLLENGKKVSSSDLYSTQHFDQGGRGLSAQQLRRANHTVVAIDAQGRAHVILAMNKTGKEIQDELSRAGYTAAVKFDGGSGFIAMDKNRVMGRGSDSVGLRVLVR